MAMGEAKVWGACQYDALDKCMKGPDLHHDLQCCSRLTSACLVAAAQNDPQPIGNGAGNNRLGSGGTHT